VLILDEPANGLDPEGIRWMRDLLRTLAAQGRTILVSSHLLGEMEQLADDLVIIAAGRLAAQGTMASVIGSLPYLSRTMVRTPELEKLAAVLGGDAVVTPDATAARTSPGRTRSRSATPRCGRASPSIRWSRSCPTWKPRSSSSPRERRRSDDSAA
jgi:ABC-2 type transport system ATP-binding protein